MKRSALKRKTPLKAYGSIKRPKKKPAWEWAKPLAPIKRATLKKVAKGRARQQREYFSRHREFLKRHPVCGICLVRGLNPAPATEVHHMRGRIGRLLADERFWCPSCRSCREFPHENPTRARELGILAPVSEWNVYPEN
jgi:hypothetical protein